MMTGTTSMGTAAEGIVQGSRLDFDARTRLQGMLGENPISAGRSGKMGLTTTIMAVTMGTLLTTMGALGWGSLSLAGGAIMAGLLIWQMQGKETDAGPYVETG